MDKETPLGKLMWEQRIFEMNGNWEASERIAKKIAKHLNNIKERTSKNEVRQQQPETTGTRK